VWCALPLSLATVLAVQPLTARAARADDTSDTLVCTAAGRQQRVADAAVLLGLAEQGSTPAQIQTKAYGTLTLDDWRRKDAGGFRRACSSVVAAVRSEQGGGDSSGNSLWTTLLPLLFGAALTLVTTVVTGGWRERVLEARRQGRSLRDAKAIFTTAVENFLAVATDEHARVPSGGTLDGPRSALLTTLGSLPDPDGSARLVAVRVAITTGPLGPGLAQEWARAEQRSTETPRYRQIRAALSATETDIEAVIRSRERPVRSAFADLWRTLRRKQAN